MKCKECKLCVKIPVQKSIRDTTIVRVNMLCLHDDSLGNAFEEEHGFNKTEEEIHKFIEGLINEVD